MTYTIFYACFMIIWALWFVRVSMIKEWRRKWQLSFKDDPDGLAYFHKHVPKFWTMFWKFWKPIKDSAWMSADVRAAKYRAELDPEVCEKLDVYFKQ